MTHPKDTSDALHPTLARLRAARSANQQPPSEPRAWLANLIANSGSVVTESSGGVPTPYTLSDNDREMICAALAPQDTSDAAEWPVLKKAIWDVVTGESLNDGHYINAYNLTEKLYEAARTAASRPPAAADVIERIAAANHADPATDDLTVPLAIELAEAQEQIRQLRSRPPAQGAEWNETLQSLILPLGGVDQDQKGYQRRKGWNDAIHRVMDLSRALTRPIQQSAGEADEDVEPEDNPGLRELMQSKSPWDEAAAALSGEEKGR